MRPSRPEIVVGSIPPVLFGILGFCLSRSIEGALVGVTLGVVCDALLCYAYTKAAKAIALDPDL